MIPVLAVFIDSLKPKSVEQMDFLSSFENIARVKTELPSYSNTCHASMYTGVYPSKHKHFFVWKYSPENSPFRPFSKLHRFIHDRYTKYLFYASVCKLRYGIVPYGYPFVAKHPINYWAHFSFETVKFWGEPDMYVGGYPTIFKILNDAEIRYQVIWKAKGDLRRIKSHDPPHPFTYIFIGHMDPISHRYGQESLESRENLKIIDNALEIVYSRFKKEFGNDFYFLMFSDHGHARIQERIDLYAFFQSNKKDLNNYLHFIDSNYARFWFSSDQQRREVKDALTKLEAEGKGFILTGEILERYHAKMSREYGDLIFYLKKPYVFDVIDPKAVSTHGYLPCDPDLDGVYVSNKRILKSYIKLEDIAPSILQALDLKIPGYIDGEPIWK